MKYVPFGDRIIIKQVEEEKKKGIRIPKSVEREEQAIGEIVALPDNLEFLVTDSKNIGDGNFEYANKIKIGDKIIYNEFSGAFIPKEDDLIILDVEDILAVIK